MCVFLRHNTRIHMSFSFFGFGRQTSKNDVPLLTPILSQAHSVSVMTSMLATSVSSCSVTEHNIHNTYHTYHGREAVMSEAQYTDKNTDASSVGWLQYMPPLPKWSPAFVMPFGRLWAMLAAARCFFRPHLFRLILRLVEK